MTQPISRSAQQTGFWSAVLATVFSIVYDVGQIAEWFGLLGSRGGPESTSSPFGLAVLLTPSLFLGSSFLVLMVCTHELASPDRKVFTRAAIAFATAYATLISIVYFVQLTLVAPRLARGDTQGIELLVFVPFNSFLYAVDILGYSFLSAATLFAGLAFTGSGLERIARVLLVANGLLIPFLALQMYFHPLIWVASLWAVTFPGSTWCLALIFKRSDGTPGAR